MPSPFETGQVYLGHDENTGQEIGIETDRHVITIAGSRTGKGAALLIPNLLRWKSGVLCIDPKGENTTTTWQAREEMGQEVVALDPFKVAVIPDRLRGGFNPLAALTPETPRIREKLLVLADGMVVSHDPKHMEWVEGTRAMLAGLLAYNVTTAPDEFRNLAAIRRILLLTDDDLDIDAQEMMRVSECGGLAKAAGLMISTALRQSKGIEKDCLEKARAVTRWLDSPEMSACLSTSSFDMNALRRGKLSLFLVLNPDDIEHYSTFFRLFVRFALAEMMSAGSGNNERVLFLLDEFYSLGKLDIVSKAAGLMPSYGVHLWPFLQDIGQLQALYGMQISETFFSNADAQIFFGLNDNLTIDYVRRKLTIYGRPNTGKQDVNNFQHDTAKPQGGKTAVKAYVFTRADGTHRIRLRPYFMPAPPLVAPSGLASIAMTEAEFSRLKWLTLAIAALLLLAAVRAVFENAHELWGWFSILPAFAAITAIYQMFEDQEISRALARRPPEPVIGRN